MGTAFFIPGFGVVDMGICTDVRSLNQCHRPVAVVALLHRVENQQNCFLHPCRCRIPAERVVRASSASSLSSEQPPPEATHALSVHYVCPSESRPQCLRAGFLLARIVISASRVSASGRDGLSRTVSSS